MSAGPLVGVSTAWRPASDTPARIGTTALIAVEFEEGDRCHPVCMGLFVWTANGWEDEEHGQGIGTRRYWWLPERELLENLAAFLAPATVAGRVPQ